MRRTTTIRAEALNEDYYARNNTPTFNQLSGGTHHFTDQQGREYTLATKNNQVFQNKRVQYNKPVSRKQQQQQQHEIVTSRGSTKYVKLYVRLSRHTKWFGAKDARKALTLTSPRYGDFVVHLKATDKPDPRRATGAIYVKGLDLGLCRRILRAVSSDDDDNGDDEDVDF